MQLATLRSFFVLIVKKDDYEVLDIFLPSHNMSSSTLRKREKKLGKKIAYKIFRLNKNQMQELNNFSSA